METALRNKFKKLEQQKQDVLSDVEALSATQLRFRPKPTEWSVLDVLDHVMKTEKASLGMMQNQLPSGSNVTFRNRVGALVVTGVMLSQIRVKVPAGATVVLPDPAVDLADISDRWNEVRQDMNALLQSLQPAQLRLGLFKHPVSGWMTTSQALTFLSAHLRHHVYQIERLKAISR